MKQQPPLRDSFHQFNSRMKAGGINEYDRNLGEKGGAYSTSPFDSQGGGGDPF